MPNYLDLPIEILDKINNYVIIEKNKDILRSWFFYWKETISYYVGGKKYYILENVSKSS
jgi:hypothetical protein